MFCKRFAAFSDLIHRSLLSTVWKGSALIGIFGTIGALCFTESWHFKPLFPLTTSSPLLENLTSLIDLLGDTGMSLFYISSSMLLITHQKWKKRLSFIAPAGRMPLTNYLIQTAVCLPLFYGYALGLYGRVSPLLGFLLVIAIYTFQIIFSVWWVRYFRFGPAEWIWRSYHMEKFSQ